MYMLGILTGMVICFAVDYLLDWIDSNIMRDGGDDNEYYNMAKKTLEMPLYPTHKCYCGKLLWEVVTEGRKKLETQNGDEHCPEECLHKKEEEK